MPRRVEITNWSEVAALVKRGSIDAEFLIEVLARCEAMTEDRLRWFERCGEESDAEAFLHVVDAFPDPANFFEVLTQALNDD